MDKYKAFLFDWDGTVARTLELWLAIIRESLEKFGVKDIADSELVKALGNLHDVSINLGLKESDLEAYVTMVRQRALVEMPQVELYDGILDALDHIRNSGKKMGIITTNFRDVINGMLQERGLQEHFEVVVNGEEVKKIKPDPEGILRAIDKFKLKKSEVVMLGDSKHDIKAALNAGIDSVLFYPASHELFYEFDDIKALGPTHIIDDWSKLLTI